MFFFAPSSHPYLMLSSFPFESPKEGAGNVTHTYKQNVLSRSTMGLFVRARTEVYTVTDKSFVQARSNKGIKYV